MNAGEGSGCEDDAGLLAEIALGVRGVEAVFLPGLALRWISPSIEALTGYSPADCAAAADPVELLVYDADRAFCRRMADAVEADGTPQDFELRLRARDGGVVWVATHWRRRGGAGGGLRLSAEHIQARKEAENALLETVAALRRAQALREHYLTRSNDERQRLSALLNLIRLGILFIDQDGRVLYHNRAMLEIWGFPRDSQFVGSRDAVLKEQVGRVLADPQAYLEHIERTVRGRRLVGEAHEFRFADGRIVTDLSAVVKGGNDERRIGRLWIYEDVTEARRASTRLLELAERDALTGLFNRRRFHEELGRMLADAERRGTGLGLLAFDLDGFKPINDSFGHQAGDEVLVQLAAELGRTVRRNETLFRIGGDEFALLVPDGDEQGLLELAHRLVDTVGALRFGFKGREARVTASVGIARFPVNAGDGGALVAAADEALYRSKSEGRNRATVSGRCAGESARMAASTSDEPPSRKD